MSNFLYSLKPNKSFAWHYKIHPYFTKQPSNIVSEYIKYFSKEGDLVLDPFSGTGVTGIEALTLNRKVNLLDLSPFACFLTEETIRSPIDLELLKKEFNNIYYEIEEFEEKIWSLSEKELDKLKIIDWYPKKVLLPKNSDFKYVHELFDKKQLIVFARLFTKINKIENFAVKQQMRLIFSGTISRVNLTHMDGKGVGGGGPSIIGKYRYWKPKERIVLRVVKNFKNRFSIVLKAKSIANNEINGHFNDKKFKIWNDSAVNLKKYIKDKSIDYIYTDPPYGAHISYLDLSTMWSAWLGFNVDEKVKQQEAIEGGDLKHSRDHYLDLMFQTAKNCYEVLKDNKYLSLVFQHKDTNLWFQILDCFRDNGFEPESMTHQETKTTSMHKKKNPLNVFGDQIIVNFLKKKNISKIILETREDADVIDLIKKTARKSIVNNIEISSEELQRIILDELYLKNKIHKRIIQKLNIIDLLQESFKLNSNNKWTLKDNEKKNILAENKNLQERIFFVIMSLLREKDKVSFDEIIATVNMYAKNGHEIAKENVIDILDDISEKIDDKYFSLRKNWGKEAKLKQKRQDNILFEKVEIQQQYSDLSEHDKTIYHLANIGKKFNYRIYIGQTEQRKNPLLKDISDFDVFPFGYNDIRAYDKSKIEQIDIIWLDNDNDIVFAFEIETSTTIKSGLERFYSMLNARYSQVLSNQQMIIIIPNESSRINLLKKELQEGTFSGEPFYMEKKIRYLFIEDLFANEKNIHSIEDLSKFCKNL